MNQDDYARTLVPNGQPPEGTDIAEPEVIAPTPVYLEPDIEVEPEQDRIDEGDPDNPTHPDEADEVEPA